MRVDGSHIPTAALNHMGGHGKAGTQGAPSDTGADTGTDPDTSSTPPAAGTASGAVPPLSGATAVAAQLAAQAHGSHGEGNPATIGKAMYAENPAGYKNLGQAVSEAAHELNTSESTPPVDGDGTPATDSGDTTDDTTQAVEDPIPDPVPDETTSDETASDTADDTTDTADGGDTAGGDVIDILPDMPEPDPGILDQALLDAIDEASDPEIT